MPESLYAESYDNVAFWQQPILSDWSFLKGIAILNYVKVLLHTSTLLPTKV